MRDGRNGSTAVPHDVDVLVIGGGNAAMCAALSARREGAEVLVLEGAPEHSGAATAATPATCATCTPASTTTSPASTPRTSSGTT